VWRFSQKQFSPGIAARAFLFAAFSLRCSGHGFHGGVAPGAGLVIGADGADARPDAVAGGEAVHGETGNEIPR